MDPRHLKAVSKQWADKKRILSCDEYADGNEMKLWEWNIKRKQIDKR